MNFQKMSKRICGRNFSKKIFEYYIELQEFPGNSSRDSWKSRALEETPDEVPGETLKKSTKVQIIPGETPDGGSVFEVLLLLLLDVTFHLGRACTSDYCSMSISAVII